MGQVPSVSDATVRLVQQAFLALAVLFSLLVARRMSDADRRWSDRLRSRFLLGVPWGTLLTVLGVLSVYWFVQGGWAHPRNPVVVAFRSWSYFYPLGTLFAAFAHSGLGHLIGNLMGTIVFAPVVEWAWGHYPSRRGSQTFTGLRTNPFARVLAVPAAAIVVGLLTSLFTLGPVIGFSGVVFAFAGFAFVTRPVLAVAALVGSRAVRLTINSLRNPLITAEPHPGFITPWWANIAIQGHALGLLLGVGLGIVLVRRRDSLPEGLTLWFAALVFAISQSLWAVYAPVGASKYVLFRAIGVGLMFVLAALVVSTVRAADEPFVDAIDLSYREAALGIFLALVVALSLVAVPFNLATIEGAPNTTDAQTVEIRDYTVAYVEGVPNQYASVINLSRFGAATGVRSSGVVIFSEQRHAWVEAVSKGRLAFAGDRTVWVGGLGWRESVHARRVGWSVVGNGSTYKVFIREDGEDRQLAFTAERVTAAPVIDGRSVALAPAQRGFRAIVTRNNRTVGRATIPPAGNMTRVGGLTLNRTGTELYAIRNDTRVKVASKQIPRAKRDD